MAFLWRPKLTAPITGPFEKTDWLYDIPHWMGGSSAKSYRKYQKWYRQAKPFDLPLNYDCVIRKGKSRYTSNGPFGDYYGSSIDASAIGLSDGIVETYPEIYNRAYARFIDQMGAAVELGVATAEGRQAISMVTRRLVQMANFTRHVARGRLDLAAGDLGLELTPRVRRLMRDQKRFEHFQRFNPPKARTREVARSFSSNYLEFHFGWKPLVRDIHDGLAVLQQPIKPHRVIGKATGVRMDPLNLHEESQDSTWKKTSHRDGKITQSIRIQGDLIIVNETLATLQQMGVVNPLSIAWELVPFSFVLDWFLNVGDYLESFTNFAGVQFLNPQRTIFTRYDGSGFTSLVALNPLNANTTLETWQSNSVHIFRRLSLGGGPTLKLRTPKPWPVARGLAAASLLMQRFPSQVIDQNLATLLRKRTAFRVNNFPKQFGQYL